jgi:hypothetical protein
VAWRIRDTNDAVTVSDIKIEERSTASPGSIAWNQRALRHSLRASVLRSLQTRLRYAPTYGQDRPFGHAPLDPQDHLVGPMISSAVGDSGESPS